MSRTLLSMHLRECVSLPSRKYEDLSDTSQRSRGLVIKVLIRAKPLINLSPISQCFGYPRVLGIPVPKTLMFSVSPPRTPRTLEVN